MIETKEITNSDDVIDVRDVIARVEELEGALGPTEESDGDDNEEREELATLTALLEDLVGNGGNEEWRGAWYPITLIRDSHFEEYAQELAEELGYIKHDARWPYTCIDWKRAAEELQQDYSTCDFDGVEYHYR